MREAGQPFRKLLALEFAPYRSLTSSQLDQLEAHNDLLQRWNERLNLTRIRGTEDVVRLHYCESLFLGTLLPPGNLTIADVGSGGGFPGVPLAVLRPESQLTLIESHRRKAVFLREASRSLANVRVECARAEEIQGRFDWAVSRAVSLAGLQSLNFAANRAFLLSRPDASGLSGEWKLIESPWGKQRVIALDCSTWNVPRGT